LNLKITIEAKMIVNHAHDSCSPSFASFARKAIASSEGLTTNTFCKPSHQKTESRTAHSDRVLLVAEPLRQFVILNMSRQEKRG
jgi:hypothetical protein